MPSAENPGPPLPKVVPQRWPICRRRSAEGRDAIVVTSGGILAALCSTLLSLRPEGVVALSRVAVNASVTTLAVGASGTTLLTGNEHAHFAGDQRHLLTYR